MDSIFVQNVVLLVLAFSDFIINLASVLLEIDWCFVLFLFLLVRLSLMLG